MSFAGYLTGMVLIAGCVVLPWFMVDSVLDAFEFERDGIELQAQIVALTSRQTARASTTWTYMMESKGRTFQRGFGSPQTIGTRLWMLELPQKPDERMLGREGDSAFELLVLNSGGYLGLLFMLGLSLLSVAALPFIFVAWLNHLRRPRWSEPF